MWAGLPRAREASIRVGGVATEFVMESAFEAEFQRWLLLGGPVEHPDVTFELGVRPAPAAPRSLPFAVWGAARLWRSADRITLRIGDEAGGWVDLERGWGHVWADPGSVWRAVHHCLRPLWFLALGRHGLYQLHASCVSVMGRGVLIVGATGTGKSTLAARFARAGARPLSDDTALIENRRELRIHGLGDGPRLHREGLAIVGAHASVFDEDGKASLVEYRTPPATAVPRLVVFAAPSPTGTTAAYPVDAVEAMTRLLRSAGLTLDPETDGVRMQVLARLAEETSSFAFDRGSSARAADRAAAVLLRAAQVPLGSGLA
jgi:hypothetical protein